MKRVSSFWRVLRLVLTALVVLAPAVPVEPCLDRVALVEGGRGKVARAVVASVVEPVEAAPRFAVHDETFRVVPRPAPVARFLLHRALLN